jgi:hypothetical protein
VPGREKPDAQKLGPSQSRIKNPKAHRAMGPYFVFLDYPGPAIGPTFLGTGLGISGRAAHGQICLLARSYLEIMLIQLANKLIKQLATYWNLDGHINSMLLTIY